jgi:hypothetical protein
MKLHGNARLSVKGRELLIDRIEVAGWFAERGRRGGRDQRAHRSQVAGPLPGRRAPAS